MAYKFCCIECLEFTPYKIRAFKSQHGRRGHEKRSGHKTKKLDKSFREILAESSRRDAEEQLTDLIDELLAS